jgi:ferric-dicitrate binding protein FerR (iron transport regulator)
MDSNELRSLIEKINQGDASEEELERYNVYLNRLVNGESEWEKLGAGSDDQVREELWQRIEKARTGQIRRFPINRRHLAAAACILIIISFGTYFILNNKSVMQKGARKDIAYGIRRVLLRTGHGRTIILSPKTNGLLAVFGKARIKQYGGTISYLGTGAIQQAVYDTLEVPPGGMPYTLHLGDGSEITLNVASSLRFPEHFGKGLREGLKLIKGEAYFDIVHNPHSVLHIETPDGIISDIGTRFNISAYADDPDGRITLVEGHVAVSIKGGVTNKTALKTGEQLILKSDGARITHPDMAEVLSWKNGEFSFDHEPLSNIMRQLSRWYNVPVDYAPGSPGEEEFSGTISRFGNISTVLHMLSMTGNVRFDFNNNRLVVFGPVTK